MLTNWDCGTTTPLMPCSLRTCIAGALKVSSHTTSLGEQPLRLLGERLARLVGVGLLRGRRERVGEPAQAADPELERLDQLLVHLAEMPGRVEGLRAVDVLLLLVGEPVELA